MTRIVAVAVLAVLPACRDLALPDPPVAPGPGTLSGRAVLPVPGRSEKRAAAGAFVRLLPTGLATRTDANGVFVLEGITRETGELLLQHDADADGRFERQRVVRVDGYKPGVGRQVQLGDIALEENASITGRVLRKDVSETTGHAGSLVFVPEGPFTATTSDDGIFVLDAMPVGTVRLAVFRAGYLTRGFEEVTLRSGQELLLEDIVLEPDPLAGTGRGGIAGEVVLSPPGDSSNVRVELRGSDAVVRTASVGPDGKFRLENLAADLYRVDVTASGYRPALVVNVLVTAGAVTELGIINLGQGTGLQFPDAGARDAGAGGTGDGGAGDGGSKDAGSKDGGSSDGGSSDGGSGGGGSDAGFDGGALDAGPDPRTPTAVLAAVGAARTGQTQVTLDGSGSSDPAGLPLVFHWAQTQGAPVVFSVNDSTLPTTRFDAPADAGVLRFELEVSNPLGLTSPKVIQWFNVLAPPVARIVPGALSLRTGLSAELDGTTSADPSGGALAYAWTVVSGPLTLDGLDGGTTATGRVRLTAGNTAGPGQVRLIVTNSAGLASDPTFLAVTVNNDPISVTADAGPTRLAGFGKPVTLLASGSSTSPSDALSFSWQQVSAGGAAVAADAGVQLSSTSGAAVSFTAPASVAELYFRLTATASPSGASGTAVARVSIVDDVPPQLLSSDPPVVGAGVPAGPWFMLTATFDEPLEVASVTPANFQLFEGDAGVAVETRYDPQTRTVKVLPRRPLVPGSLARLTITGVTDASPAHNAIVPVTLPFNVRSVAHDGAARDSTRTDDLKPVPLINSTGAWVGYFINSAGCGAASSFVAVTLNATYDGFVAGQLGFGCGGGRNEQRNHALVGESPHYRCNEATYYRNGSVWSSVSNTNAPISLNTDGVTLSGTNNNGNLRWHTLNAGVWNAVTVDPQGYFGPGVEVQSLGGAVQGNRSLSLAVGTVFQLKVFEQVASGAWTDVSESVAVTGHVMPRGAYVGDRPVVCATYRPAAALLLRCLVRNAANTDWLIFNDLANGAVDRIFDVQARGDTVFLTYAQAGKIWAKYLDTSAASPAFVPLVGPNGASNWNNGATCLAKNPAMQVMPDGVWIAWQEDCGPTNHVVLRRAK